ncbi:MAG: thioredoxin domain-containing protein [Bryobacteraceae bacterium]
MPTNRLAGEKSPYLLQHAHNPVDWYPWGDEAFAKARAEDKPIFLSIGYSTCHWCHVMERESFENDDVAAVLNRNFVCIKLDREERPDLDRIYMLFVQSATGSGGWPMSVWLTPDAKPFFGGTYFPPDNRYGRPGFKSLLEHLSNAWKSDREKIERSGTQVIQQLHDLSKQGTDETPGDIQEGLDFTFNYYRRTFDPRLGGFGPAPKFPRPSVLNFLLRYSDNEEAQPMVFKTLDAMAKGGMNDQLGGGFHRYSVDDRWFVPHFEKMLYDQAQLAQSYLEAYQITKEEQFAQTARDIFEYVLRDLTHPEGGFYSAEDADSAADPADLHHKSEGAFYIWTQQELIEALGREEGPAACRRFGVAPNGNVAEDPHGEFGGRNILYLADETSELKPESVAKLLEIRGKRPRPHLDDKVLAGWNGMMISAFARGAQVLDEPRYAEAAKRAAAFVRAKLWRESDAMLLRRYRDGDSAIEAFLDDYACLTNGLIDLYEATFERGHLAWAELLASKAIERFGDPNGGFFSTPEGQSDLVLRLKDDYDGAEPSANSVMTLALLRLARMREREDFRVAAERTFAAFAGKLRTGGPGLPQMLVAQMFAEGKPMEVVFAGETSAEVLRVARRAFLPNAIFMRAEHTPDAANYGKDGVYVCENFTCQLPVFTAAELEKRLQ